jgi:hypothetical protein
MQSRVEYFVDLLEDCVEAVAQANLAPEDTSQAIAALILSDSYNGLRKSILQASAAIAHRE